MRAIRVAATAFDHGSSGRGERLARPSGDVFPTITLPLMAPGIAAGAVLAFARAIGEFGATITFVSNIPGETQTLEKTLIYTFTQVR